MSWFTEEVGKKKPKKKKQLEFNTQASFPIRMNLLYYAMKLARTIKKKYGGGKK